MRPILLVLALLALPGLAAAEVRMPDGKDMPRKPIPDPDVKPDGDGKVPPQLFFVAYEGIKPLELPEATAPRVELKPALEFMSAHAWAADIQTGGESYVLLVETNRAGDRVVKHLGWVNKQYLVRQPRAQFNQYTRIYRKAMIINSVQTQKKDKKFLPAVPVRLAPSESANPGGTFRLFSLFYIYGQADGFVLLGGAPEFDIGRDPDSPRKTVLGWLPTERVKVWNTREAVEWDAPSTSAAPGPRLTIEGFFAVNNALRGDPRPRRTVPGLIYATPADAYTALKDRTALVKPLFSEKFDRGESIPLPPRRMRFPVFDWTGTPDFPRRAENANELLLVGVKGDLENEAGQIIAQEKIDEFQEKLERIKKQISKTEVVVVIDDTESMGPWFEAVADLYDQIAGLVLEDPLREVRMGITYYNDNEDGKNPNPVVVHPLADVRKLGREAAGKIRKHDEYKGGGSPREMVFAGLTKGVKDSGWSPTAARKILIHIGDFGDHSDKEEDAKKVADAFLEQSKHSPVEFYSIQVIDPETTPNKKDSRAFRTQVKTILKMLNQGEDHYACLKLSDGQKVTAEQKKMLRDLLRARYDEMAQQVRDWTAQLERAQRGDWENTRIDAALQKILIDNGVNLDELRKHGGFQVFQEGYVWRKSPQSGDMFQIRDRILVNGKDLRGLIAILDQLTAQDPSRPKVADVVARLVETHVGDSNSAEDAQLRARLQSKDITVQDIIAKATGLKVRPGLLNTKLRDLNDDRFTADELHRLAYKKKVLEDILANKQYRYEEQTRRLGGSERKYWHQLLPGKDVDRRFSMGGRESAGKIEEVRDVEWYWIDLVEEWP